VAFLRDTVARGDQLALGGVGNGFFFAMKVDKRIVNCWRPVLLPQGQGFVVKEALMRKVYFTKLYFGPASPTSCTLRKLELDAKAEEASGDRVRIVLASATMDGNFLGPTALHNGRSNSAL